MAHEPRKAIGDRRFVRRTLIVFGLAALIFIAWELRSLLLMLFGAVVVATIFQALADRIEKVTHCRESIAVAVSILIILGLVAGFAALFGGHLAQQVEVMRRNLPVAWRALELRINDLGLSGQIRVMVDSIIRSGGTFAGLGRLVLSIGNGVAEVAVVLVGGIYLAAQPRIYRTGVIKLTPPSKRHLIAEAMDESEAALRLWLKGQLIAMAAVGTLTGLGLWLLGMPSAMLLGLIAGILEFVPFAGPILSAIPAILLALAVSPDLALWVALLYFGVQQLEGYVITPLVQQYAVDLPGMVLLFSLIAFGIIFGTLGVVLAAPLTVVSYVLVKRLYVIEALHTPTPIPGENER